MKIKQLKYVIIILAAILAGSILLNLYPETFIQAKEIIFSGKERGFLIKAIYNGITVIIFVALLGYVNQKYVAYIMSAVSGIIFGILSSCYIYSTGGIKCIFYCMVIMFIIVLYNLIIFLCLNKSDILSKKISKTILNDILVIIMLMVVITLENYVLVLF